MKRTALTNSSSEEASLPSVFREQALSHPRLIAVSCDGVSLDYSELDRLSDRLAAHLQSLGVKPGEFVGVLMHRSTDLAVALMAILKASAAYVPLDPDYPSERLGFMINDSGARVLIVDPSAKSDCIPESVIRVNASDAHAAWRSDPSKPPLPVVDPDAPAYMIYTSGSTGTPKGVVISHRAILHSLAWLAGTFKTEPGEGVLQKAPISFDFSVWEIFFPLVTGMRLVFAKPGGQHDTRYLADLIRMERIAWAFFVPSLLSRFLETAGDFTATPLRHVFCSGEPLPSDVVRRFFRQCDARLHNVYGPTEAAVEVTHWECVRGDDPADPTPIGMPFPGISLELLGDDLEPVPYGGTGELCIGGPQLALRYHARPELTAASFITGKNGSRLYRTGDNARQLSDGTWLCLGRRDHQIKLRGFRVELGEIETALQSHPNVQQAIVGVRKSDGGESTLVAWMLARGETPDASSLREQLLRRLPDHMVPARFVWVDAFPLNPSGKIDRAALPDPGSSRPLSGATFRRPETTLEKSLAELWQQVLQIDAVGIDDPFFEVGGDSLSLVRVHALLETRGFTNLPVAELFEFATIRELAARLEQKPVVDAAPADDRALRQRAAMARRRSLARQ